MQSLPSLCSFFFYFFHFKAIASRDLHVYFEKKNIVHAKHLKYFVEKIIACIQNTKIFFKNSLYKNIYI